MPYFYRNNIKYSGGSDSVDLTMAEYKELEANGKVVQDITYYIIDADENIPSRPNLLINSNFANPVNQRGITAETWKRVNNSDIYGIDRWKCDNVNGAVKSLENGITIDASSESVDLKQHLEKGAVTLGKTYTLSACIDGVIYSGTVKLVENTYYNAYESDAFNLMIVYNSTTQGFSVFVRFKTGTHTITWAKLELGEYATPYAPRLYAEEFQLCQRYYQYFISDAITYYADTDSLYYRISYNLLNNGLRVVPTVTIDHYELLNGTTVLTDFNVVIADSYSTACIITATKSSHGLTNKEHTFLRAFLRLDAEL